MNIAELAHMEDQEDQDQDTIKAKVTSAAAGGAKGGDKRASLENPRKSLEKSVTLTRQASDANR